MKNSVLYCLFLYLSLSTRRCVILFFLLAGGLIKSMIYIYIKDHHNPPHSLISFDNTHTIPPIPQFLSIIHIQSPPSPNFFPSCKKSPLIFFMDYFFFQCVPYSKMWFSYENIFTTLSHKTQWEKTITHLSLPMSQLYFFFAGKY